MNEQAKHTPGPWEACDPELWGDEMEDVLVAGEDTAGDEGNIDNEIAIVRGQEAAAVRDANVRLIAAAPDLLAACEAIDALARELIAGLGAGSSRNRSAAVAGVATMFREKVQAAIAKATGAA